MLTSERVFLEFCEFILVKFDDVPILFNVNKINFVLTKLWWCYRL